MLKHPLFLIIDGMSQAYRAHFAIRGLSTSQGLPTNAVYGFALMLKRVLDKFPPEHIAVAMDSSKPTMRHEQYDKYKATRPKMPADLAQQIPYIRKYCEAMRIPVFEAPGYEADDVIATLCKQAETRGWHPVVVTLDKDLCQLVGTTLVLNTAKDDMIVDREKVVEIYGVAPEQIPDLLGLWGDSSDNVPGAPGIGEKTAKELIQRFGSLEACLERAGEVQSARQRASLMDNREQILLSKQLVTVDSEVPLEVNWAEFQVQSPDRSALLPLLKELEFTGMVKEYVDQAETPAVEVRRTDELPAVDDGVFFHLHADRVSFWTGTGTVADVPIDRAMPILSSPSIRKITFDLKHAMSELRQRNLDVVAPFDDVLLMTYLLMPNRGRYDLTDVVLELLGCTAAGDVTPWIEKLWNELQPKVEAETPEAYHKIDLPLVSVLEEVERHGIRIDTGVLNRMSGEMSAQLESLTSRIYQAAGCEFNINSPKQLGEILFEKLNLPHSSKKLKKSGQYSTAVEVLEELAVSYELPRLILDFRQYSKFKSTYVDVIPTLVGADGRIHTSFNQTGAATGRLSSINPNLQNIPVRTELGRKIRGAFIPEDGWWFVAADYSQVELRVVAHMSGDAGLAAAFEAGVDVHRHTAAEVLGVPIDAITAEQRERAKAVNFGIVYGQTPFGLAQQLGISNEEAAAFIARYFERYPGVQLYMEECLRTARDTGMTRTMFGRLRQHPEINSRNGLRRSMAERTAINSPIQGTAADIIKLAMIQIAEELHRGKLRTRMVLQVHDELIFEVPEDELPVRDMIRDRMQGVVALRVPLTVDVKQGRTWEELG